MSKGAQLRLFSFVPVLILELVDNNSTTIGGIRIRRSRNWNDMSGKGHRTSSLGTVPR